VSGKVIAKGPKVGRLFPIQFSIPSINSCAYSTVIKNPYFWHKKLGHPNSNVLTHLMKHGYLRNKNSFQQNFWIVVLVNWVKVKHYHFLYMVVML
jgi:hypothetical protein